MYDVETAGREALRGCTLYMWVYGTCHHPTQVGSGPCRSSSPSRPSTCPTTQQKQRRCPRSVMCSLGVRRDGLQWPKRLESSMRSKYRIARRTSTHCSSSYVYSVPFLLKYLLTICDCKAGLFSAVLSAFLLASLPALRPDPNDRMLAVLDRIALQSASYSFQQGVLTTMAPPAQTSTPFEPSADDVRVNVLWFASLLLSLITASFGILVKQWLREFLAVDVPSPQARLRIRHFRAPAVESWKVFEIAAALPLLLQLSLGLFFIGLCYFTRSVHSSIGYTTIPLVAGWAFCIFTSTFLPIFFPRCPYKTRLLRRLVRSSYHYLNTTMRTVPSLAWSRFLRSYASWDRQVWKLIWNVASNAHRYLQRVDEVRAVSSHAMDMQILASVDAIQSDDELLRSAILESVTQIQPSSKSIIDLIYRVLEHRLQWAYSPAGIYGWHMAAIDLRPLTHQARAAVSEMLNLAVSHSDFDDLPTKWQEVNSNPQFLFAFLVSISLSVFSHPLPNNVLQFMKVSLSLHGQTLCHIVASSALPSYVGFLILREGLLSLASTLNLQFDTCLNCFEAIVDASLTQLSHVTPSAPTLVFERWNEDEARNLPWRDIFESETLLHSVVFLLDVTGVAFKSSRETEAEIPGNARAAIITAFCIVRHISSSDSEAVGDKLWDLVAEARSSMQSATVLLDALLSAPTDWIFGTRAGWFHVFEKYQDRHLRGTSISRPISSLLMRVIYGRTRETHRRHRPSCCCAKGKAHGTNTGVVSTTYHLHMCQRGRLHHYGAVRQARMEDHPHLPRCAPRRDSASPGSKATRSDARPCARMSLNHPHN